MILTKQNSKADLIKEYADIQLEGGKNQVILGISVDSGINAHETNWQHQLDYFQKDYPEVVQTKLRQIIEQNNGDIKVLKRSQSVQSSIKYIQEEPKSLIKSIQSPNFKLNLKRASSSYQIENEYTQQQTTEQKKEIDQYVNLLSQQSSRRSQRSSQQGLSSRMNRQFTPDKSIPEWKNPVKSFCSTQSQSSQLQQQNQNIYPNHNITYKSTVNQNQQLESQLIYHSQQRDNRNQSLKGSYNNNEQYQQNQLQQRNQPYIKNMPHQILQRSQSAYNKPQYIEYKNNQFGINDQKNQTQSEIRERGKQSMTSSIQDDKYNQMKDYIQNSLIYDSSSKIISMTDALKTPSQLKSAKYQMNNRIQDNINNQYKSILSSQISQNKNYNNSMNQSNINNNMNYNKSSLNNINQNNLPERYQMMMQYIQKSDQKNRTEQKVAMTHSILKNNTQNTDSPYVNFYSAQNSEIKKQRKKIFDDHYQVRHNKSFNNQFYSMFGRSNTEQ